MGTGAGALPGAESSVWLGATALSTSAMASIDLRMALPTAVRRPVASVVIDVEQDLLVGGGRLDDLGEAGEGDDPDLGGRALALDELGRGGFGGQQPVGLDVGGAHAARDVDGEDHRRLSGRHRHDRDRARGGQDQAGDAEGEQRERQVAPDARAAWRRLVDERQAGVPDAGPAASGHPDPDGDQDRNHDEQGEGEWRQQADHRGGLGASTATRWIMAAARASAATRARR